MNHHSLERVQEVCGTIVDVVARRIYRGRIQISNGRILSIIKDKSARGPYILPGFIDAHIHVESSMLTPREFARLASVHGTVGTVSDPHEIANVCGVDGIDYMIKDGEDAVFHFAWGAPSCVPATQFETAGAELGPAAVAKLLERPDIRYLSEVMNFPGVIAREQSLIDKIEASVKVGKPVDGHAPGLMGEDLKKYVTAGIHTDHESYMLKEAQDKLALGMKIIIREGSAAKNFAAIHPILKNAAALCMFGSDDKHPNDLAVGHINTIVARAIGLGYDLMDILNAACVAPVRHYNMQVGLLQPGDSADFIEVVDLTNFDVVRTVIRGMVVAEKGVSKIPYTRAELINNFHTYRLQPSDFFTSASAEIRVIEAHDGQLITNELKRKPYIKNGRAVSDTNRDILKIAVVNRYKKARPAVGFIKNFGLKRGAIASSVAHDSHNIVLVGTTDEMIAKAANLVIEARGGVAVVSEAIDEVLPLPVAGLMSNANGYEIARSYAKLDVMAKELGSSLAAPFMTLSFMALPVIPSLKITDKGLFDGMAFRPVELQIQQ